MFNRESQPTITELVVQLSDSEVESGDSTADSDSYLARIGVWVWAFMFRGPYFILSTVQAGTTTLLVFGMTGPSTNWESNL